MIDFIYKVCYQRTDVSTSEKIYAVAILPIILLIFLIGVSP